NITPPSKSTLFPYTTLFRSSTIKYKMDGKTCGLTGNLSRHLKSHLDKIDISTKKQADFMKKFLTQDTAEKIVNIYTNITSTFFVDRKSTRLNSSHLVISYAV